LDPGFGKEKNSLAFIKRAVNAVKTKLNSIDTQIYMSDMYDMEYGLYNHTLNRDNPIATVSFFDSENTIDESPLEESIRRYIDNSLGSMYKISLIDYFNLPRHYIELMIQLALEESSKGNNALDDIKKELEK
jgi:hypothetical protein